MDITYIYIILADHVPSFFNLYSNIRFRSILIPMQSIKITLFFCFSVRGGLR